MYQNVCESYSVQRCQSYLYKNYTFCFYEYRTSPVIRAFEQYVEFSFCLWNILDYEVLRESYDIHNPYVLYESRVSFPQFPDPDFFCQNAFGIPVYERRSFNLNCLRRLLMILAVLSFLLRPLNAVSSVLLKTHSQFLV